MLIERLRIFLETHPERMPWIALLWTTTFFTLWWSYEGWKFGIIWNRWKCTRRQAVILALVALATCIAGLWLAAPVWVLPP